MKFTGGWHDEAILARGEIRLDSLRYKNLQLTEVRGPLYIDNAKILLGAPTAPAIDPKRFAHLSARAYGGVVYGDCWLTRDSPARFAMRSSVFEADLGRLAREVLVGRQQFSGKLSGTLQLRGDSGGARSLTGAGAAQLRDANFYELPLMVSLFKVLKLKTPDPTAFTTSDIRYRVEGERVYLDEVKFAGDAISLRGRGEVNFDRQVRLLFRTELGRQSARTIIGELIGGASEQIMVVHVDGTLDDPKVHKEPFPGVAKVLQQLQADLQAPRPQPPLQPRRTARGYCREGFSRPGDNRTGASRIPFWRAFNGETS